MQGKSIRILLPSIIDPTFDRGGAGAVTRAFVKLLQRSPLNARIEWVFPGSAHNRFHKLRQLTSIARSLVSPLPAKAAFTYSQGFLGVVRRFLREREFDLVMLNGSDLLWLSSEFPPELPCILLAHNIEHRLFLSQLNSLSSAVTPLRRVFLRDWRRLQEFEISGMRRVRNVIFLSSDDCEFALKELPDLKTLVVPPLFDYDPLEQPRRTEETGYVEIGFLANFRWWPNREGLRWFLTKVFPYTEDDLRLHLFGDLSWNQAPRHPRIIKHGFLSRPREMKGICDFMICPIFSGGGISVKFLEALYNGVPVIATSFAARGLSLESDPCIVILDQAEEWIRFLRSADARALRFRAVPAKIANILKIETHVESLRTFIEDVALKTTSPEKASHRLKPDGSWSC